MAYEQNDLTFSLFKNEKKTTEKHPDYTGTATASGVAYFMDAWINETKGGAKYMSGKLKRKDNQKGVDPVVSPTRRQHVELRDVDSDIPF